MANVPSAARVNGGVNRASSRCSAGSTGASRWGAIAHTPTIARITDPRRAEPEWSSGRIARDERSGKANAGVEDDVDGIEQHVEEEDGGGHGQHHGLHHG